MVSGQVTLSVQVEMMSLHPYVLAHMHIHVHADIHWALWRFRIWAKQRYGYTSARCPLQTSVLMEPFL